MKKETASTTAPKAKASTKKKTTEAAALPQGLKAVTGAGGAQWSLSMADFVAIPEAYAQAFAGMAKKQPIHLQFT
jgi:hypothetical protein